MMTNPRSIARTKVSEPMTIASPISLTTSIPLSVAKRRVRGIVSACLGLAMALAVPVRAQTAPATAQPVIVADFNHDGIPDALVQSATTPTATIAFGSVPYGTFSSSARAVTFPAVCTTISQGSIITGDFNGDGFPDIAFVCGGTGGVMLGNGDGTFGAVKTLAGVAGGIPVAGDFNHDGKLDIAILYTTGDSVILQDILMLPGNGDGTFGAAVTTNLGQTTYSAPVVADVNGDNFPDLILGSFNAASNIAISVFGNNQDGTFGNIAQGVSAPSVTKNIAASAASSILVGSFFGKNTVDFVVPGTGANPSLYIIRNTSSAGAYALAEAVASPYTGLTGAAAGSFTGSGYTDLAVANGTSIAVLANDGTGNFAANYSALTLASTSNIFSVADANGDGYADIYMASVQAGAIRLAVNLVSGTATATSMPFSLGVGTKNVSAAWPGNVNFNGTTATGTQMVVGVPSVATITSSKNPSMVGDAVAFGVKVATSFDGSAVPSGAVVLMDGTTVLASGNLDGTGSFSFMTSALTQGAHSIKATYAGDTFFAGSVSSVLSQVVNQLPAVTSIVPSSASVGASDTPVTLSGTGFSTNSVVQVNGTAIATTVVNATTLTAVIPAADFTKAGTLEITVADAGVGGSSPAVAFLVVASVGGSISGPPTAPPGTQPTIGFTLANPYPVDLTVTLTLGFASSTTPQITNDQQIQFSNGGTTLSFTLTAGTVTAPPIQLQAGTVAGTITIPFTLTAAGVDVTPANAQPFTILVPTAVPTISGAAVMRSGDQLTVVVHGFSNTREMVTAKFHFTAAAGEEVGTPDVTVPATTIFNDWFSQDVSQQYGSTFTYTQIFNTTDGGAATIGAVEVTLTNTVGDSTSQTAQ